MNEKATHYLQQLNRYLGRLQDQERVDILEEVESHIFESANNGTDIDAILETLGNPKELASSYINESVLKNGSFNLNNLMKLVKFYFITGFSGMFIIPCIAITSAVFYLCSFVLPLAVVIKIVAQFFGYSLPIAVLNFGFWQAPDFIALPICLIVSVLLYISSKKMWQWLKDYLFSVSAAHRKIKNLS
ncbi:DUF1700 domain-containing protein [Enterococcus sp. LJL128]|uniref:DUF1700 domain-containing protein n=1 Tax=Enterococcus sp. LJL51 TaxID=3416656 RepID=UPI003CEFA875